MSRRSRRARWASSTGPTPAGDPQTPSAPAAPPTPRAADFEVLSDVTSGFDVLYGGTSFNAATGTLFADVALKKNSLYAVRGDTAPLLVGIKNISQPLVELLDPDGVTPDGIPYYDVSRRAFSQTDVWLKNGDQVGGRLRNATGVLKNIPKEIFESSSMKMLRDFAIAGLTASGGACQYENEYRQWIKEGKPVAMRFFCFRTSTGQGRTND